jgi:hypothetical protein
VPFFEPPPPPPEQQYEEYEPPAWSHPPTGVVGGELDEKIELASTDRLALIIDRLVAYPNGVELTLSTFYRSWKVLRELQEMEFGSRHWPHWPRRKEEEGLPPELLRFGIQFSDGSKVTSVDSHFGFDAEHPALPLLMPGSGGTAQSRYSQGYWLTPLPPEGPLAFVCEWPAQGIELTRVEIDAAAILDAAARAKPLWASPA